MDIDIGAAVFAAGGEKVGTVDRVIVDPISWEVSDIVVHASLVIIADFIVPVSLIASAEKGEVRLRATVEQLKGLPHFIEAEFEVPPPGAAEHLAYSPGNILVPMKLPYPPPYPAPPPPPPLPELAREITAEAIELTEGTQVEAVDGVIGSVDDVLLDSYTDRVTAVVVRKSDLLRKDVTIPIEWVSEASRERVKIAATKEQVEHLLGPPAGWYLPVQGRRRRRR